MWDAIVSCSGTREPTVDGDVLPGQVGILRTREPGDEGCDLLDTRHAPQRHGLCQCAQLLGAEDLARQLGVRESRRHTVCEHTVDRKSTRLNSSHLVISYAVFCLKKKT